MVKTIGVWIWCFVAAFIDHSTVIELGTLKGFVHTNYSQDVLKLIIEIRIMKK